MPRRGKPDKDGDDETFRQHKNSIEILDEIDLPESLSSEEDNGDDPDPVMKTYDVFVSNQLRDHMYLLQYPIRNPDEQNNEFVPYDARIKPKEGSLELDVPIDTTNYSAVRGERFAGSQDSNLKQEIKALDRQRLTGKTRPNQASYFVGVIREGFRLVLSCFTHL
jgi:DNA-directed RNA polymerase-3 subunit RPC5